ncbi:hypothetical protein ACFUTU_14230 [Arthrobacter sp. NPDC057388]|jgi:hypothetical protein|uniref:hypothetical protein n=1 Tax=Arthrobacter sp. NPDC057388 TaxID=3346116 RepID=UPI0036322865
MAEKPKSVLLPVMAVAVFAGLGRMVIQKIKSDRAARQNGVRGTAAQNRRGGARRSGSIRGGAGKDRVAGPVDEKTRQWISEVVRTPRQ